MCVLYAHIHTCICMHVLIYMYHSTVRMHASACVNYASIHPRVYACMRPYVYACMRPYVYACMHPYVYACMRPHVYACIYLVPKTKANHETPPPPIPIPIPINRPCTHTSLIVEVMGHHVTNFTQEESAKEDME